MCSTQAASEATTAPVRGLPLPFTGDLDTEITGLFTQLSTFPPGSVRTSVQLPILEAPSDQPPVLNTFNGLVDGREHVALQFAGDSDPPVVRLHSECLTGDVFNSARCDCGQQLADSVTTLSKTGGILLYLRQEGRGIGLYNKIDAYALQERGLDTYEANRKLHFADDQRSYIVAAQMLRLLNIGAVRLLTNNPDKVEQLRQAGIEVMSVHPTATHLNPHNESYIRAKREQGHLYSEIDIDR